MDFQGPTLNDLDVKVDQKGLHRQVGPSEQDEWSDMPSEPYQDMSQ